MSTREAAIEAVEAYFDSGGFRDELAARVAVPSSSREEEHRPDLLAYQERLMRPRFEAMGFDVALHANPALDRAPFLLARRIEAPGLPTLFCYGHGDTVPGEEGRWKDGRDPWTLDVAPDERWGERWYGRGTADNKGQHAINMEAMRHVLEARGRLGYNVTFLIEMAEEMGSPGLREFCFSQKDLLKADLLIASDGPRLRADLPDMKLGTRGVMNFRLRLEYREGGHHSGNWGGLLANPAVVLMHAIASIIDRDGHVKLQAIKPERMQNSVRAALGGIEVVPGPDDPAIDPWWGERGFTAAEKVFGWNTFEVLSFISGNPDKPQNAVPPFAEAICQIRFVVDTDPDTFLPAIREHLAAQGFEGIEIDGMRQEIMRASRLDPDHPAVGWATRSIERTLGIRPGVIPNSGGSLPNDIFLGMLGMPTLWVPHSYPGCSQHAPDEHVLAPLMRDGLRMMTGLFWDLGEG
ncbi:MAG TPA: M20/M25/M40 family metallo-hydrolase, partial [Thalassobaculum sp.]